VFKLLNPDICFAVDGKVSKKKPSLKAMVLLAFARQWNVVFDMVKR